MSTATKNAASKTFKTYQQVRVMAGKPLADRVALPIGRNGKKEIPRKYHLDPKTEIPALKTLLVEGDKFPNPHNKGFYSYAVETFKHLGLNRPFSLAVIIEKFKTITSEVTEENGKSWWTNWSTKEPRNPATARDWQGRFEQNLEVLMRRGGINPYGLKLHEVGTKVLGTKGACIDKQKNSSGVTQFMLNTDSPMSVDKSHEDKTDKKDVKAKASKKPQKKAKAKVAKKAKVVEPVAEPVTPVEVVAETPVEVEAVTEVKVDQTSTEPAVA